MGLAEAAYSLAKKTYKMIQEGIVSTNNYNALYNKPSINGINLEGALSSHDLQILEEEGVNALIDDKTKDLATIKYVDDSIEDIELAKFPNVTIIGSPVINGGQMSGFNSNSYARFPFLVDLTNKPFEINFDILTGSDVANQQNIFDSDFGFAFAVRNSRFVIAMSSNGSIWDIGEAVGTSVVFPNTQYKIKISWDLSTYKVELSTNGGKSYVTDISKNSALSLYPKQIFIGVGENYTQVLNSFSGMIDFTKANLIVDGNTAWVGLDVVGLETRLAKDVSNIDAAGEERIRQIAGGGGSVNPPYTYLKQRGNYIYEIQFDNIAPNDPSIPMPTGGCTTVVKDGKVHRNFDYEYTNNTSFIVVTPNYKGMAFIDGLHNGDMRNWDMNKVAQLPNRIVDGINDSGLFVSTHIIFNDSGIHTYEGSDGYHAENLVSYILENFHSAAEIKSSAFNDILEKVYIPETLLEAEYVPIYFIHVQGESFVMQPKNPNRGGVSYNDQYELMNITSMPIPKLTNFLLYYACLSNEQVNIRDDNMQYRPTGVERYNDILSHNPVDLGRFTVAYEKPNRLSEFIGATPYLSKYSSEESLIAYYEQAHELYLNRERDGKTWQTMHYSIYDISSKTLSVCVQERFSPRYYYPEQASQSAVV